MFHTFFHALLWMDKGALMLLHHQNKRRFGDICLRCHLRQQDGLVTVILVNQYITDLTAANRIEVTRFYCAIDACGNSKGCAQRILKQ